MMNYDDVSDDGTNDAADNDNADDDDDDDDADACFACILLVDDISTGDRLSAEIKTEHVVDHKVGTVDAGKQFACSNCDFTTIHLRHYTRHVAHCRHGNSEKPTTCNQEFVSASDLNGHLKSPYNNSVMAAVPCPCCRDKFDTATKLERHLRDDHDFKQKILSCTSCNHRSVLTLSLNQGS